MKPKRDWIPVYLCLFILGWVTQQFSLFDIGKYSIVLIYFAAIPICLRMNFRSLIFTLPPLISTIVAVAISFLRGVSPMGVISQAALQLLAIAFAAGVATIDWEKYFATFVKMMVVICAPIVAYSGYQMIARAKHLPYAFLPVTNQQEYATGGLQRGWEKAHFTRASAVFVEPAEFGYLCLWLMIIGLSMRKGPWRIWSLVLAFAGLLFSQSLSGALGLMFLLVAYITVNPVSFNIVRQLIIVLIFSVMAIFAIEPLMPDAFEAFYERIHQAFSLDSRADSGRVDHLPANVKLFMEEPVWGHGLASISSADDNGVDVTTFTYFLMLIERGIIGSFLFFVSWVWMGWRSVRLLQVNPLRTLCALLSALNIYIFGASSLVYSLPFWFALGICASCALSTFKPATELTFRGFLTVPKLASQRDQEELALE